MGMKSLARWITDKYICLLLLVFPLWTGFDGYAQITRWKFIFYAVITVIWAVLLIFFAVRRREKPRCPKVFAALLSALLAWAAVSALASEYSVRTLMGWNYDGLLPMALYTVTALGVAAYGEIKKYYVNLLAVSASICCVVALLQLLGQNPLWLYPEGLDYYDAGIKYAGSFLGTLGNTNILGSFLCICCPLFAFTALFERARRLWLLLPAALCLAVLVLSRSEAGLLGIAAAALIGVPYYVYLNHKRRSFILTVACEAAIVCAALCVLYFTSPEFGTLWEAHEILHGRVQDGFGSSRVAIWREALRLFAEEPLLGGGPGSFGMRSALEFSRFVEETGMTVTTRADNAHSAALTALADLGVPGLLLWCACWAYVLTRRGGAAAAPAALCLLSYLAQSLFAIETCFVLPFVCVFSGLSVTCNRNSLHRLE